MTTYVVRNVRPIGSKGLSDILIQRDTIEGVVPAGSADKTVPGIDGEGNVALPSFVDAHIHLDKAFLADRSEYRDSVPEKIRITRDLKRVFTVDDVKERALRGVRMAAAQGTGAIRTSVDIDPVVGMRSLRGLLELKQECTHLVDLQIAAFAQEGLFKHDKSIPLLRRALEMGADLCGGHTGMDVNPDEHITSMLALAKEYEVDVEFHVDESGKSEDFWLPRLAQSVMKAGYEGRVSAIHCCSLATVDDTAARDGIAMLNDAGMNVVVCPTATGPMRKLTRVSELVEAGITLALGSDNLRDTWYPMGNANLLLSCNLLAAVNRLFSGPASEELHNLITYNGAKVLKIPDYGLERGKKADIVVLHGASFWEALVEPRPVKIVLKRGRVVDTGCNPITSAKNN